MPNQVIVTHPSIETIIVSSKGVKGDAGKGIPTGGEAGQILVKVSNEDFDLEWVDDVLRADNVLYSGENSGLAAGTMQEAIDLVHANHLEVVEDVANIGEQIEQVVTDNLTNLNQTLETFQNNFQDLSQDVVEHLSNANNPHNVTAEQVSYTPTGGIVTALDVQNAITQLEHLAGLPNNGRFLGVLEIELDSPLPSLEGLENGDYYILSPEIEGGDWHGFFAIMVGDTLIFANGEWNLIKPTLNETDPVFRASPAFTILNSHKTGWNQAFTDRVISMELDNHLLRLNKAFEVHTVDLSEYANDNLEGLPSLTEPNTFEGDQRIVGEVVADTFRGSGENLIRVRPQVIYDNQDNLKPLLTTFFTDSQPLASVLVQDKILVNSFTGELVATSFTGDGSGLTDVIENVEIGEY